MAKLKDLSVSFLSLVKTPATGKALTLKSARPGERAQMFDIVKTDDELMRAYGVVYAPDQVDAHGDTADAATIRRAATEFMREGRLKNIDTEHSFSAEMAFVAESWLVRKGDPLFGDEPDGAWAVGIQIGDPDLWRQLKSGELTGISLAGVARVEPSPDDPALVQKQDTAPSWVERLIKALTGAPHPQNEHPNEETLMDKETIEQIVRDTLKSALPGAITDALKGAGTPDTSGAPDAGNAAPKTATQEATTKSEGAGSDAPAALDASDTTEASGFEQALQKHMTAFERKLDDKIAKALAKGATETVTGAGNGSGTGSGSKESFV